MARLLNIGQRTLWRLASKARGGCGSFPRPVRIGPKLVRWRWVDVQEYLQELGRN